jgi:tetratricopeptide (TPR) repeat protein
MISCAKCFGSWFLAVFLVALFPAAHAQVRVWQGTLTLPSYEEGQPNPNPPFDQFAQSTNYPYTLRDQLTNHRVDHAWRAVYLENKYLKCSVLPDLGGHIYTCIDKISGQSMFYANPSLKKAEIGYRGGWAAYGVEFNFPVSHNWVTLSPVDYSFASHPDGSASVTVGNIDRVYGMEWNVEIVLRPASTVLELRVALNNRSDTRHRFYWWSNAGIQVWGDSRATYPMRFGASHGFTEVVPWPVDATGTDMSVLKNQQRGPVSVFVHGSREPYMGIWHPHTNTGVVHYSEYEELPGKKIWSWGSDPDGVDWRQALSDNNSAYMEVQGGLFRNQETYAFLEPRQTIYFSEYWMPVRGLGGFVRANLNAVANLSRTQGALRASLNVNHAFPAATVRILDGSSVVLSEKQDLAPERTWTHDLKMADAAQKYTLEAIDAQGNVLLRHTEGEFDWTPKEQIKVGPQPRRAMPLPAERNEGDWLQASWNEELDGARLAAMTHYEQALERFPGSLPLRKAAGRLAADLLRYDEAVRDLEPVRAANTSDAETAYYLGIAYEGLERNRDAELAYAGARLLPEFHAAASVRLAELEARRGDLQHAEKDLREAAKSSPDDVRSVEELVAVQQALGETDAARALATERLKSESTSYVLKDELGESDGAHLGADVARVLNVASMYMGLGFYERALAVLSRNYPAVPADQREPGEASPQEHALVAYYRGYCLEKLGRPGAQEYAAAAKLSTRYVFPSGALTYQVLQAVLRQNSGDAHALWLAGELEFSIGLTDAAFAKWEAAQALDSTIPVLDATMGRTLLHLKNDVPAALEAYRRGIVNDSDNLANYFGMDQALSLLGRPASERVAALDRFPDKANLPTNLVYELALNRAESGDFEGAEALFQYRYFQRAEGGTNVREVWTEVRLLHAHSLAGKGQCDAAMKIGAHLTDPVPGFEFTQSGMVPVLRLARINYSLGLVAERCGKGDDARHWLVQAATSKDAGQTAWAHRAAKRVGAIDEMAWRKRLTTELAANAGAETSLQAFNAALLQRELGDEASARERFRTVLLMPDSHTVYHLAREEMSIEK